MPRPSSNKKQPRPQENLFPENSPIDLSFLKSIKSLKGVHSVKDLDVALQESNYIKDQLAVLGKKLKSRVTKLDKDFKPTRESLEAVRRNIGVFIESFASANPAGFTQEIVDDGTVKLTRQLAHGTVTIFKTVKFRIQFSGPKNGGEEQK